MWAPDASALTLLDTLGSPFGTTAFRTAVVSAVPGWHDVSFGARASDGTLAAVALLARGRDAESVPPSGYGGVVASRELDAAETLSFLRLASRTLPLRRLRVRSLELPGTQPAGERFAAASVVPIDHGRGPADGYARLARRSMRRARAAGATSEMPESFASFWGVYEAASRGRGAQYPERLLRRLVEAQAARAHVVRLNDRVVASLLTLVGPSHWMCWLAGQTEEGRAVAASYLAYDAVFGEAHRAGVSAVNLGASVGGGAEFKNHLGAHEVPMREWRYQTAPATAAGLTRRAAASAVARVRAARTWFP